MIIIVVGMNLIFVDPYVISCIVAMIRKEMDGEMEHVLDFTVVIAEFNSSVNILIYYNCNAKLRTAFRKMLGLGAINTGITQSA